MPLASDARAVQKPASDLREQLHEALYDGRLLELPVDDWPPGCPKDRRALQISRMARDYPPPWPAQGRRGGAF